MEAKSVDHFHFMSTFVRGLIEVQYIFYFLKISFEKLLMLILLIAVKE